MGVGVNRQGCFAEYLAIPASNAFKLPDAVTDDIASILDPFGNATHTALAFNMVGEDVLITGAGPIGIMAVAISKTRRRTPRGHHRRQRLPARARAEDGRHARHQRHAARSSTTSMKELGMQEGFDVGLEMSGNPTAFRDMLRTMHHGGSVALLGIPPGETAIDWNQVIFKGLNMRGIYGREMFETWYKMAALLQAGLDITPVITHHFPIQEFQRGFETMGSGQSGKVILDWSDAQLTASVSDVAEAVGVAVIARVHARPARRARAAAARTRATTCSSGNARRDVTDEVLREPDLDLQRQRFGPA